ncbi:AMP-binding protein [Desulfotalea psychrophila]|nr:AMP-binding protein [Desulfotalea psychrophila]
MSNSLLNGVSLVQGDQSAPLKEKTIAEELLAAVSSWGDREFLYFYKQDIRLTYREFSERVDNLARGLAELGLKKGERVGIWSQNRLEWVLVQFATARLGLVLVNINPACRLRELDHILSQVDCSAIIFSDRSKFTNYFEMVTTLIPQLLDDSLSPHLNYSSLRFVIRMGNELIGNILSLQKIIADGEESHYPLDDILPLLHRDDPVNIQFTSGTTGQAKGATLSHFNILNNASNVTARMNFGPGDRLCLPVPLYHCFGMVLGVLGCLSKGASIVFPAERFTPKTTLKVIEQEACTALYGVPAMYISMLSVPSFALFNLSSLRTGIMAGAPCPIEVMREVVGRMHLSEITIAYGMTETSPVSFQSEVSDSLKNRVTTVGRVHPHVQVKLVSKEGKTVPVGVTGELWTRGYSVMCGYWADPERTAESIQDGWMRTGDLAVLDEEGYCSIVGRLSDMILRCGENIYPREIENYLYGHPAIQEVQVFGIPDPRLGEELCAWIIVRPEHSLEKSDIRQFCRGKIASYKIPHHISFVDEMPMSVTGKPQKFKMRAQMCAQLGLTV